MTFRQPQDLMAWIHLDQGMRINVHLVLTSYFLTHSVNKVPTLYFMAEVTFHFII